MLHRFLLRFSITLIRQGLKEKLIQRYRLFFAQFWEV